MKKLFVTLFLFVILLNSNVFSQTNPDNTQKMYYLCKVWGYLKYFHSEVAKGTQKWDSVLFSSITEAENATTGVEFNNVLLSMVNKAGPMAVPTTPPSLIEDSLKYNLELQWFNDPLINPILKLELDTVLARFREQTNYYIIPMPGAGNPALFKDTAFYFSGTYPVKEVRLVALFRYWNIINYFYPYKNITDQDWDSTLVEFITKISNAANANEYHLAFLELATHINDSHAFTMSSVLTILEGSDYPPFNIQYIENETVITKVLDGNTSFRVGDIVKIMDGVNIQVLRDSLWKYTIGSNDTTINRNLNTSILRGENGFTRITVENTDGTREVNYSRYLTSNEFNYFIAPSGPIWKIIDGTNIGYVDMGRLEPDSVASMFKDLWNTRGIIFDIRNYPQGSIYAILDYLTTTPIPFVKFTIPYIAYPGSFNWMDYSLGGDNPQPELYTGGITILFNEETQSHAEFTSMAFDYFDQTYKIGSQTAGADGNVSYMQLPGGITTYFTGLGVYYPDGTETQRVGIVPDLEVHPTINGIREGRDEVLEAAIKRITDVDDMIVAGNLNISPNPIENNAVISYKLDRDCPVSISIHNTIGSEISIILSNHYQTAGNHQLNLSVDNLNAGMYYLVIEQGTKQEIIKVILIK